MKKRRLLSLLLAAACLLALCALTGCAGRGESRTEDDPLTAAITQVTEETQKLERLTAE